MERNQEIIQKLLGLGSSWPNKYAQPSDTFAHYVRSSMQELESSSTLKSAYWEGGFGQGYYSSFSGFSFWLKGRHQYPKGSVSCVNAAFLYISHLAPVAVFGHGEAVWTKNPFGNGHVALLPRCDPGMPFELAEDAPVGFAELAARVKETLLASAFTRINIELVNSQIFGDGAQNYTYYEGLEWPRPTLIKDLLFQEGIDWTY